MSIEDVVWDSPCEASRSFLKIRLVLRSLESIALTITAVQVCRIVRSTGRTVTRPGNHSLLIRFSHLGSTWRSLHLRLSIDVLIYLVMPLQIGFEVQRYLSRLYSFLASRLFR